MVPGAEGERVGPSEQLNLLRHQVDLLATLHAPDGFSKGPTWPTWTWIRAGEGPVSELSPQAGASLQLKAPSMDGWLVGPFGQKPFGPTSRRTVGPTERRFVAVLPLIAVLPADQKGVSMELAPGPRGGVTARGRSRSRRRKARATAVVVIAIAAFAAWLKWRVGGATSVEDFDDLATAVAALTAALLCLRTGLTCLGGSRGFWLLMAAACGAWTAAEVVWAVYDIVLRTAVPVPSWADLGYLSAIPLVVAALVSHPALSMGRRHRGRAIFDGTVAATAVFFLSWTFVLGPLWRHTDLTSFGGIVAVAYPFGDIVMVFLVVLVIREMSHGDRFALGCVLAGLVAMAAADSTYTYLTEAGRYSVGQMVDVGWVVGYLGLALGAFCAGGEERTEPARAPSASGVRSLVVAFLPTLLAMAVLTTEVAAGRQLYRSDWFIAMALVVLCLARQVLILVEQFRPMGTEEVSSW